MKAEDYVHRIGRTGRAGANGLAITLAERMDSGMIRRIQQFTTQSMPVTTIAGLEPKVQAPKMRRRTRRVRARRGHAPRHARRPSVRAARQRRAGTRRRPRQPVRPRPAGARRAPRPGVDDRRGPARPAVVVQAARQAGAASASGRLLALSPAETRSRLLGGVSVKPPPSGGVFMALPRLLSAAAP